MKTVLASIIYFIDVIYYVSFNAQTELENR